MSKYKGNKPPHNQQAQQATQQAPQQAQNQPTANQPNQPQNAPIGPVASVARARRCPLCWTGLGGKGMRYSWRRISGIMTRRYYRCDQCGHTWTVDVKTFVNIEHMDTPIEDQQGPELETR